MLHKNFALQQASNCEEHWLCLELVASENPILHAENYEMNDRLAKIGEFLAKLISMHGPYTCCFGVPVIPGTCDCRGCG